VASPYLSHLIQSRGIRRAAVDDFSIDDNRDMGRLGPDPRKFVAGNIWLISDEEIKQSVRIAMNARPPGATEQILYLVVVSQDPIPIVVEQQNASGYHNTFQENGSNVFYGVLLNQSAISADDAWNYLPGVFAHELVEACTDPDVRTGFIVAPIGEICDTDRAEVPAQLPGFEHQIKLALYWSELVRDFVAPTSYSLLVALGKRLTESVPSVKSLIQGGSIRNFILAGFNA
jgi:hypothetical protein